MNDTFGRAWLLDRSGNCIDVYAHPSESFEFESIVDIVSQYGSETEKIRCNDWKSTHSDSAKAAIIDAYNQNWCKVRLWRDNKLTFRISSTGFNWYPVIIDFLCTHPYVRSAGISVANESGKLYWDDVPYSYSVDPVNVEKLSFCFIDS